LAPGLHKNYLTSREIFDINYVRSKPIENLADTFKYNNIKEFLYKNHLWGEYYHFSDSDGIVFQSTDLFYTRQNITEDIALGIDGGIFSIEQKGVNKYNGIRYGASVFYKNFQFRLGKNDFDDFSQIVPSLFYRDSYKNHSYVLEYTHQNALFYTYALCPYENRLDAHHFSITDYITLTKNTNIWTNLEVNLFDNSDTSITGQFDWRFYYDTLFNKNFTYDLALEGWYTSHTKPNSCFYSPNFSDATLLRFDPQYRVNRYFGIRGELAAGYSYTDQQIPYKYGLWIFGEPLDRFSYTAGCLHSNAARLAKGGNYYYEECRVSLDYTW